MRLAKSHAIYKFFWTNGACKEVDIHILQKFLHHRKYHWFPIEKYLLSGYKIWCRHIATHALSCNAVRVGEATCAAVHFVRHLWQIMRTSQWESREWDRQPIGSQDQTEIIEWTGQGLQSNRGPDLALNKKWVWRFLQNIPGTGCGGQWEGLDWPMRGSWPGLWVTWWDT